MRDANEFVVLYALALTVLGSLLVWALPLAVLRLSERWRRGRAAGGRPGRSGGSSGKQVGQASSDFPQLVT